MRQIALSLALLGTALMSVPQIAEAFSGRRGTTANQVDAAVFEVLTRGAGRGGEYWCGAADFARRGLGAGWTDRIYVARERGPSVTTGRRSAVHFTLSPEAAGITPAQPSISLNSFRVGDNMSVQQANTYCNQPPARF